MKPKPTGIHATFTTDCHECSLPLNITNGRVDPHQCGSTGVVTLSQLRAALDNR